MTTPPTTGPGQALPIALKRDEPVMERVVPPFWVKRVRLRGYKSVACCDVALEPLTVLVGPNGSGKSNFLSALALLAEVPTADVREILGSRRGFDERFCRLGQEDRFSIGVGLEVLQRPTGRVYDAWYEVSVSGRRNSWADRFEERLQLVDQAGGGELGFVVRGGHVGWTGDVDGLGYRPSSLPSPYRFLLGYLGEDPFRAVSEGLSWMGFYHFHPEGMRIHQPGGGSNRLERAGQNLPGVIASLEELAPVRLERIQDYLQAIIPEVEGFRRAVYGDYETVQFAVRRAPGDPILFDASSMSDGTLRATAALLAVFQMALPVGEATVVGIEEPEAALHPAALRSLLDALLEATGHTQVILTTHSAELLAEPLITPAAVRVVRMREGRTEIGPVDAASLAIIQGELNSLAGLHQEGRLKPDPAPLERLAAGPS